MYAIGHVGSLISASTLCRGPGFPVRNRRVGSWYIRWEVIASSKSRMQPFPPFPLSRRANPLPLRREWKP